VGFYDKHVLPHILDLAMRNKDLTKLRAAWIPRASGEVLEIGLGSGLNLPFYSHDALRIRGVDPSPELQRKARKRAAQSGARVEFLPQSAEERLPIADASIDTAVVTWTLCSIPDPVRALAEVRRVLKPEGRLIFIEHGRSDDPRVVAWQDRITPKWKRLTGGCHLNRKVDEILAAAGFRIAELKTSYLRGPRPLTFTYEGWARPA
jgi:ubiquinone/menaquinone biosynthesis C-methylase UbiE